MTGKDIATDLAKQYKLTIETGEVELISTGISTIDKMLGGGLPLGRFVEIFGPESSAKTTLAFAVVAEAQRRGYDCMYIDVEHSVDPFWAEKNGVNWDALGFLQPNTAQDALSIAEDAATAGCKVVVLDSYAGMTTEQEMAGDIGDANVGLTPRIIGQFCRRSAGLFHETNTLFIAINQIREKIGVMFGSPETTPGGKAPKYFSSVRLRTSAKLISRDKQVLGSEITVKSVKNKVAPQHQVGSFSIFYETGIDYIGSLVPIAADTGLLVKSGSWYSNPETGEKIGQGEQAVVQWFADNPDEYTRIKGLLNT